jgi:hypothetical protein
MRILDLKKNARMLIKQRLLKMSSLQRKNPPNCGEENQVFGNPSVGVKTKEMRNWE